MVAVAQTETELANPYPGLRPFEEEDFDRFFGRDEQVDELLKRLEKHRFVGVVGVSGSGKSSLVRAGLVPALRRGFVARSGSRWRIAKMRPGEDPIRALSGALAEQANLTADLERSSYGLVHAASGLARDESLLLVVDQFEELFRYKEKLRTNAEPGSREMARAAERASDFVRLLLTVANSADVSVYIVITMRSDYFGDCAQFRDLPETLNSSQYLVPRMTREQRREAIELPLRGRTLAPGLVQELLNDAGDEPDHLPVLQHALARTWEHGQNRQSGRIEVADYVEIGRFERALNDHAEEIYDRLDEPSRKLAQWIFKRLTAKGSSQRETRSPARLNELYQLCGASSQDARAQVVAIIGAFQSGTATFLTWQETGDPTNPIIDISHESLIQRWDRLKGWVEEEAKAAKTFIALLDDARRWTASRGNLLSGLDLRDAEKWKENRNPAAAWACEYVDDGDEGALALVDRYIAESSAREKTLARRRWIALGGLAGLVVLFAGLAAAAGHYYQIAAAERAEAEKQRQRAVRKEQDAVTANKKTESALRLAEKQADLARTQAGIAKKAQASAVEQERIAEQLRETEQLYRQATSDNFSGDYKAAIQKFSEALSRYRLIPDRAAEAATLINIGLAHMNLAPRANTVGEYTTAVARFEEALGVYRRMRDAAGQQTTREKIGETYDRLGEAQARRDPDAAVAAYKRAANVYREIDRPEKAAETFRSLAKLLVGRQDPAEALTYFAQARQLLRSNRASSDPKVLAGVELDMARLYGQLDEPADAIRLYIDATVNFRAGGDNKSALESLTLSGRLVQKHKDIEDHGRFVREVREQYEKLAMDAENAKETERYVALLGGLSHFLRDSGELPEAAKYTERITEVQLLRGDPNGAVVALEDLGKAYVTKMPPAALRYYARAYAASALETSFIRRSALARSIKELSDRSGGALVDEIASNEAALREADFATGERSRGLAVLHEVSPNKAQVPDLYEQAIREFAEAGNWKEAAMTAAALGAFYKDGKQFDAVVQAYDRERRFHERAGLPLLVALAWRREGVLANQNQDWPRTDNAYRQAIAIYQRLGDRTKLAAALSSAGSFLSKAADPQLKERALVYSMDAYDVYVTMRNTTYVRSLGERVASLSKELHGADAERRFRDRFKSDLAAMTVVTRNERP